MTRTLVIDNYDSFTYNLVHLLAEVNGRDPIVVKNDRCDWDEIRRQSFDNLVISPGPGHPDRDADFGVARDAIRHATVPVLGVCLGHQGMGSVAGGRVVRAPHPVHGKTSRVRHTGTGIFEGIPDDFEVARYHSLIVERPLPAPLRECAWTEDGLLMGFEHRERPHWGVQFHPESIITAHGRRLLENFRRLTQEDADRRRRLHALGGLPEAAAPAPDAAPRRQAFWRELPGAIDTERAFAALFGGAPAAFWLDGGLVDAAQSRWSYLGTATGPHAALVRYEAATQRLEIDRAGTTHVEHRDLFDYLEAAQADAGRLPLTPPPCPFQGGHVGWFGYELRSGGLAPSTRRARTPDALFVQADRFLAVDHLEGRTYLVAIDDEDQPSRAQAWLAQVEAELAVAPPLPVLRLPADAPEVAFRLDRDEPTYLDDVARCLDWIGQGETYQVCLTNEITCPAAGDSFDLYRVLRRVNPAPYAAYVAWPGGAVISASPERFLQVDAKGLVETKPIKGTIRRVADAAEDAALAEHLRTSTKDCAENVMIVDLLRNDLSRVCRPGSVVVPKLFGIETFATVHQLVSTIQGRLRDDSDVTDLVRATFPGGSMTGAPKVRTLELIDQLEHRARGVYSGALGWIGADGASDLSIVIRTIVRTGDLLSFGVGGGIVADSTPEGEYAEMLLKAQASMRAIRLAGALAAEKEAATANASASAPDRADIDLALT
jgi:para-aminobenzoate synthetase